MRYSATTEVAHTRPAGVQPEKLGVPPAKPHFLIQSLSTRPGGSPGSPRRPAAATGAHSGQHQQHTASSPSTAAPPQGGGRPAPPQLLGDKSRKAASF